MAPGGLRAAACATYFEEIVARAATSATRRCSTENSALDFDDILMKTVELLRDSRGRAERYRERYEHVLVDEFQDTNVAQYVLARLLAPPPDANICVVGDPDQSIYSWRSADIRNILNFERDYPKATVVRLEQNYRSHPDDPRRRHADHRRQQAAQGEEPLDGEGPRRPHRGLRGLQRGGRGRLRRRRGQAPARSRPACASATSPSCTAPTPSRERWRSASSPSACPTGWSAARASTNAARSRTCSPTCASSSTPSTRSASTACSTCRRGASATARSRSCAPGRSRWRCRRTRRCSCSPAIDVGQAQHERRRTA